MQNLLYTNEDTWATLIEIFAPLCGVLCVRNVRDEKPGLPALLRKALQTGHQLLPR
jgi:hypothetical protein